MYALFPHCLHCVQQNCTLKHARNRIALSKSMYWPLIDQSLSSCFLHVLVQFLFSLHAQRHFVLRVANVRGMFFNRPTLRVRTYTALSTGSIAKKLHCTQPPDPKSCQIGGGGLLLLFLVSSLSWNPQT